MPVRLRSSSDSGAALVELVFCSLLLVLLLAGAADFARVFHHLIDLGTAARAGAQYGAVSLANSGDIPGMQAAAVAAAPDTPLTPSASRTCWCVNDSGSTFTSGVDCTAPCPNVGDHQMVTVTVTAGYTFRTFIGIGPFANGFTLTRTATLRAQ